MVGIADFFYNPKLSVIKGDEDVTNLAQLKAQAQISQWEAANKERMQRHKEEMDRIQKEAYANQVKAQMVSAQREKALDNERANEIRLQNSYAPLQAIQDTFYKDPQMAAQMYEQLKTNDMIPKSLAALEMPKAARYTNDATKPGVESRMNIEALPSFLKNFARPKEVMQLEKTGVTEQGKNVRQDDQQSWKSGENEKDRELKRELSIQKATTEAKKIAAQIRDPRKLMGEYQRLAIEAMQSGDIDASNTYAAYARSVANVIAVSGAMGQQKDIDIEGLTNGGVPTNERAGSNAPSGVSDPLGIR